MTTVAEYFDALLLRRQEALRVRFRVIHYRDSSRPQHAHCHANVDRWVAEHPRLEAVRGWLVSDYGTTCMFEAHSIARLPRGRLIEITYPVTPRFLPHRGAAADFDSLKLNHAQQFWPPPQPLGEY
ncbi:hypothetical protein OMP43_17815 [Sphingomonas sp. CBMAI 2297]|uniref:hypothetical protein n=1 Tax=Sphingomonas sp. CBMAI 2297 TaxID=2991720 RepID=UPI002455816E|nr:hypothetical protein [Sphingomonas sp. CBMAI 2297]MDH4745886.1 hypothetical protein [Sphingomonas sp. CBMAI 2297]